MPAIIFVLNIKASLGIFLNFRLAEKHRYHKSHWNDESVSLPEAFVGFFFFFFFFF